MAIFKYVCYSHRVNSIAIEHGWLPGARYTNLRDIRNFDMLGFIDIDWENYDFNMHLKAVEKTRPIATVARDIIDIDEFDNVIMEASELSKSVDYVIIVPKDLRFESITAEIIPKEYVIGYSVPTKYGGTKLPINWFKSRKVHILGGHPAIQRKIAETLEVVSIDCNRFTLDASYGDFFDGETFRPHHKGGLDLCIRDSIININKLWENY